jgi:tryptophan-rich sensory protein
VPDIHAFASDFLVSFSILMYFMEIVKHFCRCHKFFFSFIPFCEVNTMSKKVKTYLISCAISLGVGVLSALLTRSQMDLYSQIQVPPLAPPAILFPIVWTILFLLMGISAARIALSDATAVEKENALTIYAVSLALNFTWSIVFFNYRAFFAAFLIILALWTSILVTILRYYRIDKAAAFLQIPYLLWVTFATYLNLAIVILN